MAREKKTKRRIREKKRIKRKRMKMGSMKLTMSKRS
tara:strand:+ start:156 stop:263 length:108 start_codon:yes stop_codon:yes gene_type:complete